MYLDTFELRRKNLKPKIERLLQETLTLLKHAMEQRDAAPAESVQKHEYRRRTVQLDHTRIALQNAQRRMDKMP